MVTMKSLGKEKNLHLFFAGNKTAYTGLQQHEIIIIFSELLLKKKWVIQRKGSGMVMYVRVGAITREERTVTHEVITLSVLQFL